MPLPPNLENTIDQQLVLVLNIDSPEVIDSAKRLAYYVAMLDAALDDPQEDDAEQEEVVGYLKDKLDHWVSEYQNLVNQAM